MVTAAGGCSRRRFLGVAGALGAALIAGCGREESRRAPQTDADVLRGLLGREQRARDAARGVAGAEAIVRQDGEHLARLSALAGVAAASPRTAPAGDLHGALAHKQQAVFAYIGAVPRLSDPALRVLAMQLAASEAEHVAALRLVAGDEPVPDPFAGFTEAGTA